jgi:hypothetical protein
MISITLDDEEPEMRDNACIFPPLPGAGIDPSVNAKEEI